MWDQRCAVQGYLGRCGTLCVLFCVLTAVIPFPAFAVALIVPTASVDRTHYT